MAEEQLGFDIPEGKRKLAASGKSVEASKPAEPRKLQDDEVFDYITGDKVVKLTETEKVRQRIARALVHQYGIDPRDMQADFPIPVVNEETGRKSRRRASIAIFEHEQPHELQYIRRIVVTKPRPKDSRTVSKIRTYAHAKEQIDEVAELMRRPVPSASTACGRTTRTCTSSFATRSPRSSRTITGLC